MNSVMTHFVAGYPDFEITEAAVDAAVKGGASYLEIQFPFSDPTADGPLIQKACADSIEKGFTLDKGFEFVSKLTKKYNVPVYIMSYGGPVFSAGIENYVRRSADAGVVGLIVPDLPYDYDAGLYETCKSYGLEAVPVVLPGMDEQRLAEILKLDSHHIYAAIRAGITGSKSEISDEIKFFLEKIKASGKKVLAGFGIQSIDQINVLGNSCSGYVVGSAIVKRITEHGSDKLSISNEVETFIKSLVF